MNNSGRLNLLIGVLVIIAVLLGVLIGILLSDRRDDPAAAPSLAPSSESSVEPTLAPPQEPTAEPVREADRILGTWYASVTNTIFQSSLSLEFDGDGTFTLTDNYYEPAGFGCPEVRVTFTTEGTYTVSGSQVTTQYTSSTPGTYTSCGQTMYSPYNGGDIDYYTLLGDHQLQADPADGAMIYTR